LPNYQAGQGPRLRRLSEEEKGESRPTARLGFQVIQRGGGEKLLTMRVSLVKHSSTGRESKFQSLLSQFRGKIEKEVMSIGGSNAPVK